MRNFLTIICLLCIGGLEAQEVPRVSTAFYCFRYAEGLQDVYVPTGKDSYQKVELSTANMIGPMGVVSKGGFLTIHRKDTAADGTEIYPQVGRAKLGSVGRPLLVLFPNAEGAELPYRVLTLDRADAKFPLGSYQFLNMSSHAMRGMVGKTPLVSKPGSVTSLKPAGEPGEMLNVVFEYLDGEQWRTMTKTRWAIRKNRRSLLCAYLDPRDKRVKLRSIPERLVPPAPEAP